MSSASVFRLTDVSSLDSTVQSFRHLEKFTGGDLGYIRFCCTPAWHKRASGIAGMIVQLHGASLGGYVWCVDDAPVPTADLMVGNGGVAHLLLRLTENGKANSFPLLLRSVARTSSSRFCSVFERDRSSEDGAHSSGSC